MPAQLDTCGNSNTQWQIKKVLPVNSPVQTNAKDIETAMLADLAQINEQSLNLPLVFTRHCPDGHLIGGVTGSTSYGWLLVKTLWVHHAHRSQGMAQSLMAQIETKAATLDCHSAWLDTSNSNARKFYERQGYMIFGCLENTTAQAPIGHARWFMRKTF